MGIAGLEPANLLVMLGYVTYVFATTFQCHPMDYILTMSDKSDLGNHRLVSTHSNQ